jgi:hypothetical protein
LKEFVVMPENKSEPKGATVGTPQQALGADKAREAVAAIKEPTVAARLKKNVGAHYQDGVEVKPGQVVQLTRNQAVAFKDKFVFKEALDKDDDDEGESGEDQP